MDPGSGLSVGGETWLALLPSHAPHALLLLL